MLEIVHDPQTTTWQPAGVYIYSITPGSLPRGIAHKKKTDSNLKQASVNQTHSHATQ